MRISSSLVLVFFISFSAVAQSRETIEPQLNQERQRIIALERLVQVAQNKLNILRGCSKIGPTLIISEIFTY